jgi:hypothetical protein
MPPRRNNIPATASKDEDKRAEHSGKAKVMDTPASPTRNELPELHPVEAWLPRGDVDVPMDLVDLEPKESKKPRKLPTPTEAAKESVVKWPEEDAVSICTGGRLSEIQSTVQIPSIIDRILDLTVPMTV